MSWVEMRLNATHEAIDWVSTLLASTAFNGDVYVTPCSKDADPDIEPPLNSNTHHPTPPPASSGWAFTVCLYLPDGNQARTHVEEIRDRFSSLYRTGLTTELQATVVEQKPTQAEALASSIYRIGNRFVVTDPTSRYQAQADEVMLTIKPSLAFGSGLHPATRISLRLLERYVAPTMSALDLGSGSGILSVAMAKLGAQVLALDNDSVAVKATEDTVRRNQVEQYVTVLEGSLGCGSSLGHWMNGETLETVPTVQPTATFDLIVANILARVHITLANDFQQALRSTNDHSGFLIVSGFTNDYEPEVNQALTRVGFEPIDSERIDEWVGLVYQRV